MTLHKLAALLSNIFDPIVIAPSLSLVLLYYVYLEFGIQTVIILSLLCMVVPIAYYFYLHATKQISNWDISIREQREPLMWVVLFSSIAGYSYWLWLDADMGYQISIAMMIIVVAIVLITNILDWKISIHASANVILACLLVWFFGPLWILSFSIPIIIAYSRVILKEHTVMQVVIPMVSIPAIFFLVSWL